MKIIINKTTENNGKFSSRDTLQLHKHTRNGKWRQSVQKLLLNENIFSVGLKRKKPQQVQSSINIYVCVCVCTVHAIRML